MRKNVKFFDTNLVAPGTQNDARDGMGSYPVDTNHGSFWVHPKAQAGDILCHYSDDRTVLTQYVIYSIHKEDNAASLGKLIPETTRKEAGLGGVQEKLKTVIMQLDPESSYNVINQLAAIDQDIDGIKKQLYAI